MLRFFLPLGVTPMMFATTHSIVLATLARLPLPEANLAVYTVVQGVTNAVKAPCLASRQATAALIHDRASYRSVMRLLWAVCAFFTAGLVILGFTPAGEWVLRHVIGLQDPTQIALAATGLRIVIFLPLVETLRNSMQGITINLRATGVIPAFSATRVVLITLFALWAVSAQKMSGIVVGTAAWAAGIGLEGILVVGYLTYRFGSPLKATSHLPKRTADPIAPSGFLKFFIPLGVMMTVTACLPPVIQSGLARGISPTETLAAFGVAWSVTTLLTGPLQMLHHAPLTYLKGMNDPLMRKVRRFCLGVGMAISASILAVAWTAIGPWLFGAVLGIPVGVIPIALQTCAALAFFPIIASWRESYWGVLMKEQRTSVIGIAKVANLTTVFVAVLLLFGPLQGTLPLHPSVVGAFAFNLGESVEAITVWRHAHDKPSRLQSVPHTS